MQPMKKKVFVPEYRRVYNELKKQIDQGIYKAGDQLPYERNLCSLFSVERVTVRKALDLLVADQLIEKRAGLGSFVLNREPGEDVSEPMPNILFVMRKNQNDLQQNVTAFNALLFFPLEQACRDYGYSLVYIGLQPDEDIITIMQQHPCSGMFLVSTVSDEVVEHLKSNGLPFLCINHFNAHTISVLPDNDKGAHAAVSDLIALGHRRIAYLNGSQTATNAVERKNGYRRALYEHGLPFQRRLIMEGDWTVDGGEEAMGALLDELPLEQRPTAVFSASDMMAIGAMRAIKARGMSVPEDISVMGFDNINMCTICSPALSSIAMDMQQMAIVAVDHIMQLISGRGKTHAQYAIRLPTTLVRRQSTAAPLAD